MITGNTNSNHEARSRSGERVAAWKNDVKSFFDNDWCRLRTLMMELEEDSWNNDQTAAPFNVPSQQHGANSALSGISDIAETQHRDAVTESAQRPPAMNRLSELAEHIERRLQTANAVGR